MNMKYTAAIALLVWLAVVGWLATMVIVKPAVLSLRTDSEETAAMLELRNAIARNKLSIKEIPTLRSYSDVDTSVPLIALLPGNMQTATTGSQASYGVAVNEPIIHAVSMVLVANGRRTAVVNDEPVRVGSRLADGSRVRHIGTDSVEIQSPDGVPTVLKVPSPYLPQSGAGK